MAVASLRYDPASQVEETKGGVFVYDGTASRFHEWSFRSTMRWRSCKEADQQKTMNMVVEGLRGEAAQVAMDIGMEELLRQDGMETLINTMRDHIFPKAQAEAKDLYRIGHKTKGPLSRQQGEPMTSYISRRRRWWRLLKSLDPEVELSSTILGDLMLEGAGLSRNEQLMVLTSTSNSKEFETVAKALLDQHARIHVDDAPVRNQPRRFQPKGKGKGTFQRWGNMGAVEEEAEEDEQEVDEKSGEESAGREASEADMDKDEVEMDVFTCLMSQGADEEDISALVQAETVAMMAWDRKGKGKGKGKKAQVFARYAS